MRLNSWYDYLGSPCRIMLEYTSEPYSEYYVRVVRMSQCPVRGHFDKPEAEQVAAQPAGSTMQVSLSACFR